MRTEAPPVTPAQRTNIVGSVMPSAWIVQRVNTRLELGTRFVWLVRPVNTHLWVAVVQDVKQAYS